MVQDPNVCRYVQNAINPLKKEIAELKKEIKAIQATRIYYGDNHKQ